MTEAWKRRKAQKIDQQKKSRYLCRAVNFWNVDSLDSSKLETVTDDFDDTEDGRKKMHKFVDEYSRKHWHVSIIFTRTK